MLRAFLVSFILVACSSSSEPGARTPDAGGDSGAPVEATCFEPIDGAGATAIKPTWAKSFAEDFLSLYGVAPGKDAFYVLAGGAEASKYGGVAVEPTTATTFIAKASLDAVVEWAKGVSLNAARMVGAGEGFAFVTYATEDVVIGGKTATATGHVVLGLVGADGAARWLSAFASQGESSSLIAANADAELVVTWRGEGAIDFGKGSLDCGNAVARFDATGAVQWSRCISSIGGSVPDIMDVELDAAGNVWISGFPGNEIDLGDGKKTLDASSGGSFLVKLDGAGKTLWSGVTLGAYAMTLAPLEAGAIAVAGHAPNPERAEIFGVAHKRCDEGYEYHVTKLSADGRVVWSRTIGGIGVERLLATPNGELVLEGQPRGPEPIAKGTAPAKNGVIGKLDADGKLIGRFELALASGERGPTLWPAGILADGGVLAYTSITGPIEVGGTTITPQTTAADLLVRLP